MTHIFDTLTYYAKLNQYNQQKTKTYQKIVDYLQSIWPNICLRVSENSTTPIVQISVIIDKEEIPVLKFNKYDYCTEKVNDVIIIKALTKYLKDLKHEKRKAAMDHLLDIKNF